MSLRAHFLASLIPLILGSGCNSFQGNLNNQSGMRHFQSGDFTAAKDEFQRAVADQPHNADYLHNLASALKREGQLEEAERRYQRALAANRSHQPSYHGLATLYREQGRGAEARDLLAGWQGEQPYTPEPYIELAWLEKEQGNPAAAERYLGQALRIRPNDHVAAAQLGQVYEELNQPERAYALYKRSLYTRWYQPEVEARLTRLERRGSVDDPSADPMVTGPLEPAWTAGATPYPGGPTSTARAPSTRTIGGQPPAASHLGGDPAHSEESEIAQPPLVAPR
ncbi:MAG: tetratricopeptide repeat protein [Planctomycetaceae bacterium]